MQNLIFSAFLSVVVAAGVGLMAKHLTKSKALAQMAMMLTFVGMALFVLVPSFTQQVAGIADRRVADSQRLAVARKLEAARSAQYEADLMSNVHRLVREEKVHDRPTAGVSGPPVHAGPSLAEIEEAWERWYRKPDYCGSMNDRTLTACANDHVKKRAEFDRLVAAGKLP